MEVVNQDHHSPMGQTITYGKESQSLVHLICRRLKEKSVFGSFDLSGLCLDILE